MSQAEEEELPDSDFAGKNRRQVNNRLCIERSGDELIFVLFFPIYKIEAVKDQ